MNEILLDWLLWSCVGMDITSMFCLSSSITLESQVHSCMHLIFQSIFLCASIRGFPSNTNFKAEIGKQKICLLFFYLDLKEQIISRL